MTPFQTALKKLALIGQIVEPQDIPGLFRINGGPELTMAQVIAVAQQQGLIPSASFGSVPVLVDGTMPADRWAVRARYPDAL